jgi:two-component system chemotaxis response regulator CheB
VIRVLVVDDRESLARSIVQLLDDDPLIEVVGTANTAASGIAQAMQARPDVVVMDHQLPDMDGNAATRILVRDCQGVRVVALTGREDMCTARDALAAGSAAWVRKAKAVVDLRETIHQVCARIG